MKKFGLVLVAVVVATLALGTKPVSADVNNFTVTKFHADQTLTRTDPQGQLHIVEQINVNFTDNNHGLLRAIPKSYKHHDLRLHVNSIRSDSGAPTDYKLDSSNGNTVIKIGDPSRTVTGAQQYTIDYTLNNVISFYTDHSELYWDVNGTDWRQPFDQVSVSLHLPPGLQQTRAPVCYTGAYGDNQANCTITAQPDNIESATTAPLQAGQGLTYVASFVPGYFVPAKWYDPSGEYFRRLLEFLAPIVIVGSLSAAIWWRRGRDPKGSGIIVPQYQPPSGLNPASVGTIYNFELSNRDITATIVQLALRDYLKIIETKQIKKLRKDTVSYQLQLLSADINKLDANEQLLITALFGTLSAGETIDINDKQEKLYNTARKLSKNISMTLTKAGYFRSNPLNAADTQSVVIILAFAIGGLFFYFLHSLLFGFSAFLSALVALWFGGAMSARTAKGVAAKEQIKGLKMYLEVAEKDRIQKLQSPDAAYAAQTNRPVKTVELFEKLLPYAIVLGVEKQWADKFEGLYSQPPDWYTGNWNTFSAGYLASSLTNGVGGAIDTAFSSPSSSSSSGFGGGFSGGGGGGGGGGGW